ncbi:LacI family DNA-binding transcriptional regulator [Pseudarthrobacter sp. So.54]
MTADVGGDPSRTVRYLRGGHVDGAIVVSHHKADGWTEELAASGLPTVAGFPPGPVAQGDFTPAGGTEAAERLLAEDRSLDGIFAASDLMARGAITALKAAGRSVPGDVAVVGFDDHLTAPGELPLTTINQPTVAMAVQAGRLLLEDIENPSTGREPLIYPARLVIRESSGPPAG